MSMQQPLRTALEGRLRPFLAKRYFWPIGVLAFFEPKSEAKATVNRNISNDQRCLFKIAHGRIKIGFF